MKSKLLFLLVICFFMLISYLYYLSYGFTFFLKDRQIVTLVLKENLLAPVQKELLVEVVRDPDSITAGLSKRLDLKSLDNQNLDAMLFVFKDKSKQNFWMKDMLFALDICWLDDLSFLSCERNVEAPEPLSSLEIYSSTKPANFVLETKPGFLSDSDLNSQLFLKQEL